MAKRRKRLVGQDSTIQAYRYALDLEDPQERNARRSAGARRWAYNYGLTLIKEHLDHYHLMEEFERYRKQYKAGAATDMSYWAGFFPKQTHPNKYPSYQNLRERFNNDKHTLCVDPETGEEWWRAVSSRAFYCGLMDVADAYTNWWSTRNNHGSFQYGFPRYKKRGRDQDRYTIDSGTFKIEGRRLWIPRLGWVRLHENPRKLSRLLKAGRCSIPKMTIKRRGVRWHASLSVEVVRPITARKGPLLPHSIVGVDVGVRVLAVVAARDGRILERVPNPRALQSALGELRRLDNKISRAMKKAVPGEPPSKRLAALREERRILYDRVRNIRLDAIHKLTTHLAKTHGRIVIEDLDVRGLVDIQEGRGARRRRRDLHDSALAEIRRQLEYKCGWYGSELVLASRWFPSTQTCHNCGIRQRIGEAEEWTCKGCGVHHNRDCNAAINLARYIPTENGWVLEGAQQGCGCGGCPPGGKPERVRDSKTKAIPFSDGSAVPLIREESEKTQPRDGVDLSSGNKILDTI